MGIKHHITIQPKKSVLVLTMSTRFTKGSGYFASPGKISTKMVNGYFDGTDYCISTIIITIIKTKQKSFEKFEMIIIIVK
jgi:hypothetical protein